MSSYVSGAGGRWGSSLFPVSSGAAGAGWVCAGVRDLLLLLLLLLGNDEAGMGVPIISWVGSDVAGENSEALDCGAAGSEESSRGGAGCLHVLSKMSAPRASALREGFHITIRLPRISLAAHLVHALAQIVG
jgi:hypothetical protein